MNNFSLFLAQVKANIPIRSIADVAGSKDCLYVYKIWIENYPQPE